MDSQHSDVQGNDKDNARQRLRDDLIIAMRAHHQRRRIRRRTLATMIMVICAGTLAYLSFSRSSVIPAPPVAIDDGGNSYGNAFPQSSPESTGPQHSIITIVRTDPDILERYVTRASSKVESISDETLLASLASLGRPTGLIRYDGRVKLTSDVTDKLEINQSP